MANERWKVKYRSIETLWEYVFLTCCSRIIDVEGMKCFVYSNGQKGQSKSNKFVVGICDKIYIENWQARIIILFSQNGRKKNIRKKLYCSWKTMLFRRCIFCRFSTFFHIFLYFFFQLFVCTRTLSFSLLQSCFKIAHMRRNFHEKRFEMVRWLRQRKIKPPLA